MSNLFDEIVDRILADADSPHIVLFPVERLSDVAGIRRWGFTVATSVGGFRNHDIEGNDKEAADNIRSVLQAALCRARRGRLSVHDCSDELAALILCERLWPGERITKIRHDIERERAEWAQ